MKYMWQSGKDSQPIQEGWYLATWSLPCLSFKRGHLTGYTLVYFVPPNHWEDQYRGAIMQPNYWLSIPPINNRD